MKVIKLKHTRKGLSEGRSHGISFGFVVPTENKDEFESVCAISTCKDYMNDLIYVETRKTNIEKVYGFKHDYIGFLKDINHIAITCYDYDKDKKAILENFSNMQIFLNKIEDYLNVKIKTVIERANKDYLYASISQEWCNEPYLISLYGLLMRISAYYNGKSDIFEYIQTPNKYNNTDFLKMKQVIKKIHKLREIGFIEQKYSSNVHNYNIHNGGIIEVEL